MPRTDATPPEPTGGRQVEGNPLPLPAPDVPPTSPNAPTGNPSTKDRDKKKEG